MQVSVDNIGSTVDFEDGVAVIHLAGSALAPADKRAIAVAVFETEIEALAVGMLPSTPRKLVEARVCLEALYQCDDADVDVTLAAIHQVRFAF